MILSNLYFSFQVCAKTISKRILLTVNEIQETVLTM